MELTDIQKEILKGKICQYCKNKTEYVDSSIIYGKSYGMIYLCKKCDAYCGVHKGSSVSLGVVANKELREAKKEAHKYFDILWKDKHCTRNDAYKHMANFLKIPIEYMHIGMMNIKSCKDIVFYSKQIIQDLKQIDKDFGI